MALTPQAWVVLGGVLVSVGLLTRVMVKIMHHRTCVAWILLSPFQRWSPKVWDKLDDLEREYWLPERLSLAICAAYWLLSVSLGTFVLVDGVACAVSGLVIAWASGSVIVLHGIVSPGLNHSIIVERCHFAAAGKRLRRWLFVAFFLTLFATAATAATKKTLCFRGDLASLQYAYRWQLLAVVVMAFARAFHAEIGLERAFSSHGRPHGPHHPSQGQHPHMLGHHQRHSQHSDGSLKGDAADGYRTSSVSTFADVRASKGNKPVLLDSISTWHSMRAGLPPRQLASVILRHRVVRALFWSFWGIAFASAAVALVFDTAIASTVDAAVLSVAGAGVALVVLSSDTNLGNVFGQPRTSHGSSRVTDCLSRHQVRASEQFPPNRYNDPRSIVSGDGTETPATSHSPRNRLKTEIDLAIVHDETNNKDDPPLPTQESEKHVVVIDEQTTTEPKEDDDDDNESVSSPRRFSMRSPGGRLRLQRRKKRKRTVSIVATTINCAEAPTMRSLFESPQSTVDENVAKWLPPGHDLYAVGVQECDCWDDLRGTVLRVLNASSRNLTMTLDEEYIVVAKAAIGSRHVKGHIGLAVFARRKDIQNGRIACGLTRRSGGDKEDDVPSMPEKTGGSPTNASPQQKDEESGVCAYVPVDSKLGMVKRSVCSKGCVGIRLRVGEAHIVFLCAHLPADAGGNARKTHRNACAALTLKAAAEQLGVVTADGRCAGAGAHLVAATHTFYLGDLNYRAVPPNLEHAVRCPFEAVARAVNLEPGHERDGAWHLATAHDELLREREAGRVFATFAEADIAFPPTFRRKMGPRGALRWTETGDGLAQSYTLLKADAPKDEDDDANESDDEMPMSPGSPALAAAYDRARSRLEEAKRKRPDDVSGEAAKAAVLEDLRPPSWTDRVLVHSLPRSRNDLRFLEYSASEAVASSDHRPVLLRCELDVDDDAAHAYETAQALGRPTADFCDMSVTLDRLVVDHLAPPENDVTDRILRHHRHQMQKHLAGGGDVDDDMEDDLEDDERSSSELSSSSSEDENDDDERSTMSSTFESNRETEDDGHSVEIDGVVLYFPIPVEDPLAKRRQLRAAANAIHQRALQQRSTAFGDQRRREFAATRTQWLNDGTTVVSRKADTVHRDLVKHVLVALETKDHHHHHHHMEVPPGTVGRPSSLKLTKNSRPSSMKVPKRRKKREPFAFAVVPVPDLDDGARRQAGVEHFAVPLSLCGRHRGVLRGRIAFKRVFRRGTALKAFHVPQLLQQQQRPVSTSSSTTTTENRPSFGKSISTFFSSFRFRSSPPTSGDGGGIPSPDDGGDVVVASSSGTSSSSGV